MTEAGVLLYGGPAAGKDTVTSALEDSDPRFQLFRRLKAGSGRTAGYRMTTTDEVGQLRSANAVLWENERYSSLYVIDRPELDRLLAANQIPVLHFGQEQAVESVRQAAPAVRWTVVELWCPRAVATARIEARETGDTAARLQAWNETGHLSHPDLFIDTSLVSAASAAERIRQKVISWAFPSSSLH
ncbi:kinase [Nocardia sp. NPDC052001]|uniref:kinase n=1 Tax=Nocardia sp. NPDC052001 TaxID=3154853 RepID=UPI00343F20E8